MGDVCDNCVDHFNPRLGTMGFPPLASFQNMTGGQLDQDQNGYGNKCDGRMHPTGGFVLPADVAAFKGSVGKLRELNLCGFGGSSYSECAHYDLDGIGPVIAPADVAIMKGLIGKPLGPKCDACPLLP